MNRSKLFLILIALFCFMSIGCKKQSRKWLVGRVEVYDAVTGEPIQTDVKVEYGYNPLIGEVQYAQFDLGKTDASGTLEFEREVSRRNFSYKLMVQKPWYYSQNISTFSYSEHSLSVRSFNDKKIALEPMYPYRLRVINGNCMGADDTLWISDGYTREAYGCADTIYGNWGLTRIHTENQMTFDITTKKNGVVNSYSVTHDLLPAEIKEITINY